MSITESLSSPFSVTMLAAAGGFVVMASLCIQAFIALFSTLPLIHHTVQKNPAFNAKKAKRRVFQVIVLVLILSAICFALVWHFLSSFALYGFLGGMVLAFFASLKRISPNSQINQDRFKESYADCFPPSSINPDDVANSSVVTERESSEP